MPRIIETKEVTVFRDREPALDDGTELQESMNRNNL